MKILYFYQYFSTSEGAWGTRVHEFTKNWVEQGHEVTVISSIYAKSDLKGEGLVTTKKVDGIQVKVINVLVDNRQSVVKRIWTFIQYAMISSWFALTLKADIVVASSGPITVGLPGLIARWLRGRKLVFEARDLWPEGAEKMGIIRNKYVLKFSYWFELLCYRSSSLIVGLSPGIRDNIQSRFPKINVISVTNAANIPLFSQAQEYNGVIPSGTYGIYFGNIGEVNHSGYLLDAAKLLQEKGRLDIRILFIGEGQLKQRMKDRVRDEQISNVDFLDLMPKRNLVSYIQNALCSIVPLKPLEVFDTSSPNKLFESMAAGVPVIQTTQGWIKDFLGEHRVGYTVDGYNPTALADALIYLKDNSAEAKQMGLRGIEIAKKFFDKDYLSAEMLKALVKVHEN